KAMATPAKLATAAPSPAAASTVERRMRPAAESPAWAMANASASISEKAPSSAIMGVRPWRSRAWSRRRATRPVPSAPWPALGHVLLVVLGQHLGGLEDAVLAESAGGHDP